MRRILCAMAAMLLVIGLAAGTVLAQEEVPVIKKWKNIDKLCEQLDALMPCKKVDLTGGAMSLANCELLTQRYPETEFVFKLNIFGKYAATDATELNLGTKKYSVDELFKYLDWMPNLTFLRTMGHVYTYAERSALEMRYPKLTTVECKLKVGNNTLMSTCTAYCTKHALYTKDRHDENDFAILKYCPNLKALDIGHNAVTSLEFLRELPQLQILICVDNKIADLTPLESQTHLEYIEVFLNEGVTDISVLLTDTRLDRLWVGGNPISDEQIAMLKEGLPNTTINWTAIHHPTAEGWRQGHPRYLKIAEMFSKGKYVQFP